MYIFLFESECVVLVSPRRYEQQHDITDHTTTLPPRHGPGLIISK